MIARRPTNLVVALCLLLVACDTPTEPDGSAVFRVEVEGENFRILLRDLNQIAEAQQHLLSGRVGVLSGTLRAGDGSFNSPYSWHLDPATVHFPDAAIELCSGLPSFVEADLDYWLNTVRTYCPWGAKIVMRER